MENDVTAVHPEEIYRTRLCLITPPFYKLADFAPLLENVLKTSDVASLIITQPEEEEYANAVKTLVPLTQKYGVASLLHNDSQLMGRTGADGLHLDGQIEDIVEIVKAHQERYIMGIGNIKTRHEAMMIGEGPVDYLFFGQLDGDRQPTIYKKSFALAEWWSSMMEVPAIVMGGDALTSVSQAAQASIDFVALQKAVWESADPVTAVKEANIMLDSLFEEQQK